MATHSNILAWRIPRIEESGGLQSMGLQRIGHDLVTKPPPHEVTSVQFSSVAQSCLTLCNPMDCSPPDSSVHGIFQASIREQVAISFSGIFLTQCLNPGLLHCRQILYHLSHQGRQASAVCEPRTSRCTSWILEKAEDPEIKLPTSIGS